MTVHLYGPRRQLLRALDKPAHVPQRGDRVHVDWVWYKVEGVDWYAGDHDLELVVVRMKPMGRPQAVGGT